MLRRILALVIKELMALLKDKKSRTVVIVPPLLQLLVFGYAATYDLSHVPLAVYDEDRGVASRELVARFASSPTFEEVARVAAESGIAPLVDGKTAMVVLHIGPEFSRRLSLGQTASVQLIADGRNSNTAMLATGYARQIVEGFSRQWTHDHGLPSLPASIEMRAWFNPNLESRWFMVPGIVGLLTLVVTMLVTSLSVAREREQGTWDQILVTPYRPVEILVGKALPAFLIGLFEATLVITVAVFWFRVPLLGSLWTLYAGLLLFIMSTVGVGLMISSLAVTLQQGLLGAFLFMVPAIVLSGFTTPIANMPMAVQVITYANPMRYFLVILRGVFLEGAPLGLLIDQFWPMAIIGAVALSLAAWLFRHRMY